MRINAGHEESKVELVWAMPRTCFGEIRRCLEHPIARELRRRYAQLMKTLIHTAPFLPASALRNYLPVFICCGALGLLAGCSSEPESHVVSAPPPPAPTRAETTTTVTTTPVVATVPVVVAGNQAYATTANGSQAVSTTVVTQAPPALQVEVVLAQPSPQHRWIPGYWTWRNEQYQWMAGHWELPPSSSSVWVAPRWEQQGNAYRFYEGYWN